MQSRAALGPADVRDDALAAMVATTLALPAEEVELLCSNAEVAPYDLEALTTGGRYWVRGRATAPGGERDFSFFVKVVQSWSRSPLFALVPPEAREMALAGLPWEVEPRVYRSDLADRLPPGLTMPRAAAVVDLDEASAALWLPEVDGLDQPWCEDRFRQAAGLLGRLAASEQVRPCAHVGHGQDQHVVRGYFHGRVAHQLVPALRDDGLWRHPLLAGPSWAELRGRLLDAVDALPQVVAELESFPTMTLHGDATPRNLLVDRATEELVLIDFGFWGEGPVGFDLGQLLVGEVQVGERPASGLPALEAICVPAYVEGLRQEGVDLEKAVVRRAHALQMLVFTALSSPPLEHLAAPVTPELVALATERARIAGFVLDLVDATA